MSKLNKFLKNIGVNKFFHYGDPFSTGVVRLSLGFCSAIYVLSFLKITDYLSKEEYSSFKERIFFSDPYFSLLNDVSDISTVIIFLKVSLIFSLFMTFGFFSRISTFAVYVCIVSINNYFRGHVFLINAPVLLILNISYLLFSQSGAAFSLDRLIKVKLGIVDMNSFEKIPLWPKNLISFQLFIMYFSCVMYKLLDSSWVNGRSVYYVLRMGCAIDFLPEFLTFPPFTAIATYGAILLEIFIPFSLINRKYIKYSVPIGVLLHLIMYFCLNVGIFSLAVICSYPAILSEKDYGAIFKKINLVESLFKKSTFYKLFKFRWRTDEENHK